MVTIDKFLLLGGTYFIGQGGTYFIGQGGTYFIGQGGTYFIGQGGTYFIGQGGTYFIGQGGTYFIGQGGTYFIGQNIISETIPDTLNWEAKDNRSIKFMPWAFFGNQIIIIILVGKSAFELVYLFIWRFIASTHCPNG